MMITFKMRSVVGVGALLCCTLSVLPSALAKGRGYRQADIVSDIPGIARVTNPDVVNPWGILIDGGAVVVALNGTGRIVIYQLGEYDDPQVIAVPPTGSAPTGIVLNNSGDFVITQGSKADPARYLVA